MEIKTNDTHYMQFPHISSGLIRGDFTYYVFKDGQLLADIPVEVLEGPTGIYTLSFVNDGTHESFWSLIAWETNDPSVKYGESWIVRDDGMRTAVFDIQADGKSGTNHSGGGVGGSPGGAIGRS